MTHGDKAKAKTGGKSSETSAAKKSSIPVKQAGAKSGEGKGGGKVAPQSAAKGGGEGKAGQISIKRGGAGEASPSPAEKAGGTSGKESGGKAKGRVDEPAGFSNPAVANAFRHAVKKYPNAFRKLTD
jgi:hypothetical protein